MLIDNRCVPYLKKNFGFRRWVKEISLVIFILTFLPRNFAIFAFMYNFFDAET